LEKSESRITKILMEKFNTKLKELKLENVDFQKIIQVYEEARFEEVQIPCREIANFLY